MERESGITTIAFAGRGAESFLKQHDVASDRFVVGVAGEDDHVIETTVGKVGLEYQRTKVTAGETHDVVVDLTDVAGVKKRAARVSIGREGYGVLQLGKGLEIVVATSVERTIFERK